MPSILTRFRNSLRNEGVVRTTVKMRNHAVNLLRGETRDQVLRSASVEDRFTWIYKTNQWGSAESLSGGGSTLEYTANLRSELPKLLVRFGIIKVFDAPCGDLNWMRHLLPIINAEYVGGDIVLPLIASLDETYGDDRVSFIHIDLIKDSFPKADLMICRDCLFHLSYEDTRRVLENFVRSGTAYLLTTTYKDTGDFVNRDIETGDFRLIDLFSAPYNFSREPFDAIDDWIAPFAERKMCLWSRAQILAALVKSARWT